MVTHAPKSTSLLAFMVPSILGTPADLFGKPDSPPQQVFDELLTSLEPDETTVGSISAPFVEPVPSEESRLCLTFRHSGWATRRKLVLDAFRTADRPHARMQRFCSCGSISWVLASDDPTPRYRLVSNRCRDRWCTPCSTEKQRIVVGNVAQVLEGRALRLMTLTLKSSDVDLSAQITRLYKSFAKLRRRKEIRASLTGGLYFLEITFNDKTRQWHPHLHALFEGSYIPQALLRDLWLDITGDSFIVDVRGFRDSRMAAGYVAKYATKGVAGNVFTDPARLLQAVEALHGRRTFQTFGTFTDLNSPSPRTPPKPGTP